MKASVYYSLGQCKPQPLFKVTRRGAITARAIAVEQPISAAPDSLLRADEANAEYASSINLPNYLQSSGAPTKSQIIFPGQPILEQWATSKSLRAHLAAVVVCHFPRCEELCNQAGCDPNSIAAPRTIKTRFEKVIRTAQDSICAAVEKLDGSKFHEDAWTREDGGGGISRVLQDGAVFEKAGVNVSVVYGSMPPTAYRAATERKLEVGPEAGRVPFFAAGISSVMHPKNPHAPTMHFNYRYFETAEWQGIAPQWWFGGGTDITPSYVYDEDMKHFHGLYKQVCDKHDPEYYHKFRKWADDYFVIQHRGERRGLGGIFFDDQNNKDPNTIMDFSEECVNSVVESYLPLVEKRKDQEFTEEQKNWQAMRRGRYVEFNLVYDRGTTFGLRTGGRIESILMSLPLQARWQYDYHPEEGTPEARLLQYTREPIDWTA